MCMQRPCKCSCDLIPVEPTYEAIAKGPVGAFAIKGLIIEGISYQQLCIKLPNEGGQYHALPLYVEGQPHPRSCAAWLWDGNREKPTLAPSIRTRLIKRSVLEDDDYEGPYHDEHMEESWHGFVQAGRAVSCA